MADKILYLCDSTKCSTEECSTEKCIFTDNISYALNFTEVKPGCYLEDPDHIFRDQKKIKALPQEKRQCIRSIVQLIVSTVILIVSIIMLVQVR